MMVKNRICNPIKVGLDANVVIYLARLDKSSNVLDKRVMSALEEGALNAEEYMATNFRDLPPILREEYLGELTTDLNGKDHYGYLEEMFELLQEIKAGVVQPMIGPTVSYELRGRVYVEDFVNKYVTEIVVSEKDTEFWIKRKELAQKYAEAGAIDLEPNAVDLRDDITADACLAAEFSLFGLNFITVNLKHLVHKIVKRKDYRRRDKIMEVNQNYGLNYSISLDSTQYSPGSFTVQNYLQRLKIYKKRGANPVLYFNDINLDRNNNYVRKIK